MSTLKDFTGLYPLSKTLRFSLLPQGRTLEHIIDSNILDEDHHRAESYKKVKKIIDEYHKVYIEDMLSDFCLPVTDENKKNSIEEYIRYYSMGNKKDDADINAFDTIRANMRKLIVARLTGNEVYRRMDKKDLIEKDLISFVQNLDESEEKKALVEEFRGFTTYFTGFNENRKNMYSADAKSTAIAYRLIHENLPKFVDNIKTFAVVMQSDIAGQMPQIYSQFEEYLCGICPARVDSNSGVISALFSGRRFSPAMFSSICSSSTAIFFNSFSRLFTVVFLQTNVYLLALDSIFVPSIYSTSRGIRPFSQSRRTTWVKIFPISSFSRLRNLLMVMKSGLA